MYRSVICFVLFACLVVGVAAPADARIIRVKWDSPNNGPGDDWDHAYRTVTAAIAASLTGDEIWVAAGTYVERITLKDQVGVYGGFAGGEHARDQRNWQSNTTTLDGSSAGYIVTATAGTGAAAVLDGFRLRNSGNSYAAVSCANGSPTIENNTMGEGCGGGITCDSASPVIANNAITGAGTGSGTGIHCTASSSPEVLHNTISGFHWGITVYGPAWPNISANVIFENECGMLIETASPAIRNNTMRDNSVGLVCGKQCSSEVSGNLITGCYFGIQCEGLSYPNIINNTVVASSVGIDASGGPSIANNIVAFCQDYGIRRPGSSRLIVQNTCIYNPDGSNSSGLVEFTGSFSSDPQFVSRQTGDFHLAALSPCRDTGLDSAAPSGWADMDGHERVQGPHIDIGADEYDRPAPLVLDDGVTTTATAELHASWASSEPGEGAEEYQFAIGTNPVYPWNGDIVAWTSAGLATSATVPGLSLMAGQRYYVFVKVRTTAGWWSRVGTSDGIIVAPVLPTLADVKQLAPESAFTLARVVASTSGADFGGFVFVQDAGRASGVRLNVSGATNRGDRMSIAGRVKRVDGEWQIDLLEPPAVVDGPEPVPLFMTQRALAADLNEDLIPDSGIDPTGLLVTIAGKITRINTGQHVFYVNDGSDLADGMGPSDWPYVGIRVSYRTFTPPAVGKRVTVTGILRVEKATLAEDAFVNGEYRLAGETLYLPVVCPRTQADIVVVL